MGLKIPGPLVQHKDSRRFLCQRCDNRLEAAARFGRRRLWRRRLRRPATTGMKRARIAATAWTKPQMGSRRESCTDLSPYTKFGIRRPRCALVVDYAANP